MPPRTNIAGRAINPNVVPGAPGQGQIPRGLGEQQPAQQQSSSSQNPELQRVQTPQGTVTVEYQGGRPTRVISSPTFAEPATSGGGIVEYVYSLSGSQLVPTPVSASGTVSQRVVAPFGGNPNTYLGTIVSQPVVAGNNVALQYQSFQPATVQFTTTQKITDPYTGKTYPIGSTYLGTTQYNPTTNQITAKPDVPNIPNTTVSLYPTPQIAMVNAGGQNIPIAYNINVSPAGGASLNVLGFKATPASAITNNITFSGQTGSQKIETSYTLSGGQIQGTKETTTYTTTQVPVFAGGATVQAGNQLGQVPSIFFPNPNPASVSFSGQSVLPISSSGSSQSLAGTAASYLTSTTINIAQPTSYVPQRGQPLPEVIIGNSNQPFLPLSYSKGSSPLTNLVTDISILSQKGFALYAALTLPITSYLQAQQTAAVLAPPSAGSFALAAGTTVAQTIISAPYTLELIFNPDLIASSSIQTGTNLVKTLAVNPVAGAGEIFGYAIAPAVFTRLGSLPGKVYGTISKTFKVSAGTEVIIDPGIVLSEATLRNAPNIKLGITGLNGFESVPVTSATVHIAEIDTSQAFLVLNTKTGDLEIRVATAHIEDVPIISPRRGSLQSIATYPKVVFDVYAVKGSKFVKIGTSAQPALIGTSVQVPIAYSSAGISIEDLGMSLFSGEQFRGTSVSSGGVTSITIKGESLATSFGISEGSKVIGVTNLPDLTFARFFGDTKTADVSGYLYKTAQEPTVKPSLTRSPVEEPSEVQIVQPTKGGTATVQVLKGEAQLIEGKIKTSSGEEFSSALRTRLLPRVQVETEELANPLSPSEIQAIRSGIPIADVIRITPVSNSGLLGFSRSLIVGISPVIGAVSILSSGVKVSSLLVPSQSFVSSVKFTQAKVTGTKQTTQQATQQSTAQIPAISSLTGFDFATSLATATSQVSATQQLTQQITTTVPTITPNTRTISRGIDFGFPEELTPRKRKRRSERSKFSLPKSGYTPDLGSLILGRTTSAKNTAFYSKFGLGRPIIRSRKRRGVL